MARSFRGHHSNYNARNCLRHNSTFDDRSVFSTFYGLNGVKCKPIQFLDVLYKVFSIHVKIEALKQTKKPIKNHKS